ncbi:VWA domain-containing protein [Archaeoglobus sp.]
MKAGKLAVFILLITLTVGVVNAYPHKFDITVNPTSANVKVNERVKIDVYVTYNGCKCHCYRYGNHGKYYGKCNGNKFNVTMVTWSSEPSVNATFKFDNESGHWIWIWTPKESGTYYVTFSATLERCHKSWTVSTTAVIVVSGGDTPSTTITNPALMVKYSSDSGVVGKPANVTINLTAIREEVKTIPADVVLVIDSSGSMDRYGTVIAGPKEVTLTDEYQKVGEFTVDKDGTTVEIDLQTPRDDWGGDVDVQIYYNGHKVSFCNNQYCTDTLTFDGNIWISGFWKGTYEVYAKKHNKNTNPNRIFIVELPPKRMDIAKSASKRFVDMLNSSDRVAVATFPKSKNNIANNAIILQNLTYDKDSAKWWIDHGISPGGGTPMGDGIKVAIDELDKNGRKDATKVIVLFTDGWWNEGLNPIDEAKIAKEKGYKIYTIGCGGANQTALKQIAEITGGKFYYATDENSLIEIYKDIAKSITIVAKNVSVSLTFTNNVTFNGNVGGSYTWNVGELAKNDSASLTLTIVPQNTGYVKVADGELKYEYDGKMFEQRFEIYANYTNNPPQIEVKKKEYTVKEGSTLNFTVEAIDPDGHSVTVTAINLPNGASFDRNVFTWTPSYDYVVHPNTSKTVTVTFKAVDKYGASTTKNVTITVEDVDRAPVIDRIEGNTTINENETLRLTIIAHDPDGDSLTYYTNATFGELNGNVFTWTPSYDDAGNYTIEFTVSDGKLIDTKVITITVNNVDRAPTVSVTADKTNVTVGESVTFTVNVKDPDNDNLKVTINYGDGNSDTKTVSGYGTLTFTHSFATAGTYKVNVTATDGIKSSSNYIVVVVNAPKNTMTPKASMNVVLNGNGPYVGDIIHIYIINETAVKEGLVTPPTNGVRIYVNITNISADNCMNYGIKVTVSGKTIYNSTTLDELVNKGIVSTSFVPMTAGDYTVVAEIYNRTNSSEKISVNTTVHIHIARIT